MPFQLSEVELKAMALPVLVVYSEDIFADTDQHYINKKVVRQNSGSVLLRKNLLIVSQLVRHSKRD